MVVDPCESESMSSDNESLEYQHKILEESLFEFEIGSDGGGGLCGEVCADYMGVKDDNKGGKIGRDDNGKSLLSKFGAEDWLQLTNGDQSIDGDLKAQRFQEYDDESMLQPVQEAAQTIAQDAVCTWMTRAGSGDVELRPNESEHIVLPVQSAQANVHVTECVAQTTAQNASRAFEADLGYESAARIMSKGLPCASEGQRIASMSNWEDDIGFG
ncbi:hypothetical protein SESBI_15754, partial [Sesbania bispinosa]